MRNREVNDCVTCMSRCNKKSNDSFCVNHPADNICVHLVLTIKQVNSGFSHCPLSAFCERGAVVEVQGYCVIYHHCIDVVRTLLSLINN